MTIVDRALAHEIGNERYYVDARTNFLSLLTGFIASNLTADSSTESECVTGQFRGKRDKGLEQKLN